MSQQIGGRPANTCALDQRSFFTGIKLGNDLNHCFHYRGLLRGRFPLKPLRFKTGNINGKQRVAYSP